MRNKAPKILPHNDMPRRPVLAIEILLDARRDVFLDVVFLERGACDVDGVLLHLF